MDTRNNELNLNEMAEVTGGRGGSPTRLPDVQGLKVYQIQSHDTLTKIAHRFHTTVDYLMRLNPTIKNRDDITAGYYMYVPA